MTEGPEAGARVSPALLPATARLVDPLLAVVFPSRCPACGAALARPTRGPLCDACWSALPRHRGAVCRCGLPVARGPGLRPLPARTLRRSRRGPAWALTKAACGR